MRDLLIINCSKSKFNNSEKIPVLERYNGVTFRVLRKFLKEEKADNLDIFILSAKFGLIPSNQLIPTYDQKLTKQRSQELQPIVNEQFCELLQSNLYKRCLLCMSQDYLQIFNNYQDNIPENLIFIIATGTIGKKLSVLYQWLYGQLPEYLHTLEENTVKGKATLKGIEVNLSQAEILALARKALIDKKGKPYNYQTWYVLIDNKKISPKWLVSQLTGLPVSNFHSIRARQILQQLGIEIYSDL
jgi:cytoplasmic iron level regulating protein YaaA (DUF328/UPF0246 family)